MDRERDPYQNDAPRRPRRRAERPPGGVGRPRRDPFENGLVKRKDVYSDSVSILRQVGLLD
jgi:hypothetical protein